MLSYATVKQEATSRGFLVVSARKEKGWRGRGFGFPLILNSGHILRS